MADSVISGAIPGIQDEGIGGITDGNEDWGSAGLRMVLSQVVDSGSYVRSDSELTFTNHDGTNDTVDVTSGVAYLDLSGVTVDVQSSFGGSSPPNYDTTLPTLPAIPVIVPNNITGVSLQDSTLSSVWLAYDTDGTGPGSAGSVYIRSDDTGSVTAPSHPSVKLGEANPDNASLDVLTNRYGRQTLDSLTTNTADVTDRWDFEPGYQFDKTVLDDTEYHKEPHIQVTSDGAYLLGWVGGATGHAANDYDFLAYREENVESPFSSVSATTVLSDGTYAVRNPNLIQSPDGSRIIALGGRYDYNNTTRTTPIYAETTDNGKTWSAQSEFTAWTITEPIPHGGADSTSNGWMTCAYNGSQDTVEAVFSTDQGQTWGNATTVANTTDFSIPEPVVWSYDDDRVIVFGRVNSGDQSGDYWYVKSTDGGSTWSSIETLSLGDQNLPSPLAVDQINESTVLVTWPDRSDWRLYSVTVSPRQLWQEPECIGWLQPNTLANFNTVDTKEMGYPNAAPLGQSVEDSIIAYHSEDSSDGTTNLEALSHGQPTTTYDGAFGNEPMIRRLGVRDRDLSGVYQQSNDGTLQWVSGAYIELTPGSSSGNAQSAILAGSPSRNFFQHSWERQRQWDAKIFLPTAANINAYFGMGDIQSGNEGVAFYFDGTDLRARVHDGSTLIEDSVVTSGWGGNDGLRINYYGGRDRIEFIAGSAGGDRSGVPDTYVANQTLDGTAFATRMVDLYVENAGANNAIHTADVRAIQFD